MDVERGDSQHGSLHELDGLYTGVHTCEARKRQLRKGPILGFMLQDLPKTEVPSEKGPAGTGFSRDGRRTRTRMMATKELCCSVKGQTAGQFDGEPVQPYSMVLLFRYQSEVHSKEILIFGSSAPTNAEEESTVPTPEKL